MKKIVMLPWILMVFSAIALISGCAVGRGGGSSLSQPTTAVVKLSTNGTFPSGALIGGIDISLTLPAGVSLKSTNPPQTDGGAVTASGVAGSSLVIGVYSAATSTLPGKVRVALVNAAGFGTGEFAIVNCDIASGSTPAATGFSLENFSAINVSGAAISGLSPSFTVDIR